MVFLWMCVCVEYKVEQRSTFCCIFDTMTIKLFQFQFQFMRNPEGIRADLPFQMLSVVCNCVECGWECSGGPEVSLFDVFPLGWSLFSVFYWKSNLCAHRWMLKCYEIKILSCLYRVFCDVVKKDSHHKPSHDMKELNEPLKCKSRKAFNVKQQWWL